MPRSTLAGVALADPYRTPRQGAARQRARLREFRSSNPPTWDEVAITSSSAKRSKDPTSPRTNPGYSDLSATLGSVRDARRAGTQLPSIATASKVSDAVP